MLLGIFVEEDTDSSGENRALMLAMLVSPHNSACFICGSGFDLA